MSSSDLTSWLGNMGEYLPSIVGALVILIVGWIVALICRAVARKALHAMGLNKRLFGDKENAANLEKIIASVIFWVIMLFAFLSMFNVLNLESVSTPLSNLADRVMQYLPRLLLAAAAGVIAWLIASVVRKVLSSSLASSGLAKKLGGDTDDGSASMTNSLADIAFWLIILLFLPVIVGALQMQGLLSPLTDMVDKLLGFLPNIIAAGFIGGIGYLIAKVVRNLVTSVLSATRADKLTQNAEGKGIKISSLLGTLAFIFVLVPALISALQALQIQVVAQPARHMLELFMQAIPNILAAGIIIFVAWFIGRFVADMLAQLLGQMGFDRLPAHLGFQQVEASGDGKATTPSKVVGRIVMFFILAFAVVEAAGRLGFDGIDDLFQQLIAFASQVLFGLIILAVGQWLASVAAKAIQQTSSGKATALSRIARIAILGLVVAMGLHAMGFADSIVNLAFGLVLGAIAVATALAFGLGGREAAGRITKHWVDGYLRNKDE